MYLKMSSLTTLCHICMFAVGMITCNPVPNTTADSPALLPLKPDTPRCISYNGQYMQCSWKTQSGDTPDTTWSLIWTIMPPTLYRCPNYFPKNNTCIWEAVDGADSFKPSMTYYMMVIARNSAGGTESTGIAVDTNKIVMFNSIDQVGVIHVRTTSTEIEWGLPADFEPFIDPSSLIYKITYSTVSEDHNLTQSHQNKKHTFQRGSRRAALENLTPESIYIIEVQAKPPGGYYWSSRGERLVVQTLSLWE